MPGKPDKFRAVSTNQFAAEFFEIAAFDGNEQAGHAQHLSGSHGVALVAMVVMFPTITRRALRGR
jgi:hypothetical protein